MLEAEISRLERGDEVIDKTALMNALGLESKRTALYSTFRDLNARIDAHNARLGGATVATRAVKKEQTSIEQIAVLRADRDYWKGLSDGYAQTIRRLTLENAECSKELRALRSQLEDVTGVVPLRRP